MGQLQPATKDTQHFCERPVGERHRTVAIHLLYVNLLRHFQRIVDFDAKVAHRAVEL